MITLEQAARLYKVHLSTIYRWVAKNRIRIKEGRVDAEEIHRAFENRNRGKIRSKWTI